MKARPFAILIAAITCAVAARAATLLWDDPNPAGTVAAFRVWRELSPGQWTNIATVGTNRWPIVLPPGNHKVVVSAVGVDGLESDRSTNKLLTILIVPGNLRFEQ